MYLAADPHSHPLLFFYHSFMLIFDAIELFAVCFHAPLLPLLLSLPAASSPRQRQPVQPARSWAAGECRLAARGPGWGIRARTPSATRVLSFGVGLPCAGDNPGDKEGL